MRFDIESLNTLMGRLAIDWFDCESPSASGQCQLMPDEGFQGRHGCNIPRSVTSKAICYLTRIR